MDKTIIVYDIITPEKIQVHRVSGKPDPFSEEFGCQIVLTHNALVGGPCDSHTANRYFEFFCLSHIIDGHGVYLEKGRKEIYFEPGSLVIALPGVVQCYGGHHAKYVEDSICFRGRLPDLLLKSGIIQGGVFSFGLGRRLLPIIEQAENPIRENQLLASLMLLRLLYDIHQENKTIESNTVSSIAQLIKEMKNSPGKWWTVPEMAEYCGISETHFRRLFEESLGVSPKNYADRLKINAACELLTQTDLTLADIAKRLGYMDPFHFSRRFKTLTGISPSVYRDNYFRRKTS